MPSVGRILGPTGSRARWQPSRHFRSGRLRRRTWRRGFRTGWLQRANRSRLSRRARPGVGPCRSWRLPPGQDVRGLARSPPGPVPPGSAVRTKPSMTKPDRRAGRPARTRASRPSRRQARGRLRFWWLSRRAPWPRGPTGVVQLHCHARAARTGVGARPGVLWSCPPARTALRCRFGLDAAVPLLQCHTSIPPQCSSYATAARSSWPATVR
jgi:hypothetical protein